MKNPTWDPLRFLIAGLSLTLAANPVCGQDFEGIVWGMPIDEVAALQGRDVTVERSDDYDGIYSYIDSAEGRDAYIVYYEVDGKVVQGAHIFLGEYHVDPNDDIKEFEAMKRVLTARHGPAVQDTLAWKDDRYRDDRTNWGWAVSSGDLVYQTVWRTPNSLIRMDLTANTGFVIHSIHYFSPEVLSGSAWSARLLKGLDELAKSLAKLEERDSRDPADPYPEISWLQGSWCYGSKSDPSHTFEVLGEGELRRRKGGPPTLHKIRPLDPGYYDVWEFWGTDKPRVYLFRMQKRSNDQYFIVYETRFEMDYTVSDPDAFIRSKSAEIAITDYWTTPDVYFRCN